MSKRILKFFALTFIAFLIVLGLVDLLASILWLLVLAAYIVVWVALFKYLAFWAVPPFILILALTLRPLFRIVRYVEQLPDQLD